jgi:hypothetical protein
VSVLRLTAFAVLWALLQTTHLPLLLLHKIDSWLVLYGVASLVCVGLQLCNSKAGVIMAFSRLCWLYALVHAAAAAGFTCCCST